ncbi:PAS domain S-box protein [Nodosilinea sp. P-1105]|uniref:PAS domain S-box protein n=1 Tax=Nodosilinea sp. P-1105 TaxID=2546229 RepID=UPI00146ED3C9|nr:PAS domain S-box protein [Nodosilinea sp. P-1105]NMF84441.1 PAS domain S-box protein [Nodosilinea sp. P-1105]
MPNPSISRENNAVGVDQALAFQGPLAQAPALWPKQLHPHPDPVLDNLVNLAGQVGSVSTVVLTLTNGGQYWCQAAYNWPGGDDPFWPPVVEPTWLDADQLAQRQHGDWPDGASAYGGMPLLGPADELIGLLSVWATRPTGLTASQRQGLQTLGQQIIHHLAEQVSRYGLPAQLPQPLACQGSLPPLCSLAQTPPKQVFQQQLRDLAGVDQLDLCAVLEHLDDGILCCDRHQSITVINQVTCRLLGLKTATITAAELTAAVQIYMPGDRTPLKTDDFPLWRGLRGETLRDMELMIVHPNGDRYMVLANSRPILTPDQSIYGAIISLYDITQRYRDETALRASNQGLKTQARQRLEDLQAINHQLQQESAQRQQAEATLRLFYDLPFLGMAILGSDTKTWLRFNDRLCGILGYSRDELQQTTWADLTHPDDLAPCMDWFAQLTHTPVDTCTIETRFIRKDGLIVYGSVDIKVVAQQNGRPDFFVITIQDISERKLIETALIESENRFRLTFEQAAVGIAHVAPDGSLLWLNPTLSQILGYGPYELIDQLLHDIIYPEDLAEDRRYANETLLGQRQSYTRQQRYVCKDGRIIWANLTVSLVRDQAQNPKYFIVVLQDITQAKLAETTLQQYAHRLRGLHNMDRAILTNFKSQDIAHSALLLLCQVLRAPQGLVALFNPDTETGEILAGHPPLTPDADWTAPYTGTAAPTTATVLPFDQFVFTQPDRTAVVHRIPDVALQSPSRFWGQFSTSHIRSMIAIPLVVNDGVIGEITLVSSRLGHFTRDHEEVAQEVADHLAIALQNARLFEQVKCDRARLHALSSQLLEAQETERRFLAHELHDEVGQALTAVKLNLHRLERLMPTSQPQPPLQDCFHIVEGALQQVRNLSLDLRPSMLDDLGLVPALRWYVSRYAERTGLQATLICDAAPPGLPASMETACFRIVQEALTNVARHAQAHRVTVTLEQLGQTLHLSIQDDGVGFELDTIRQTKQQGTSLGLLGMEERGMLVGGQLTITSAPTQGTCIHLQAPLANLPTVVGKSGGGP